MTTTTSLADGSPTYAVGDHEIVGRCGQRGDCTHECPDKPRAACFMGQFIISDHGAYRCLCVLLVDESLRIYEVVRMLPAKEPALGLRP